MNELLTQALAGLSTAQVALLTYLVVKVRDMDNEMKDHAKATARLMQRVSFISGKLEIPESDQ